MAKTSYQKTLLELMRSITALLVQQCANTLTRELQAKKHILLNVPLDDIRLFREEFELRSVGNNLFAGSRFSEPELVWPESWGSPLLRSFASEVKLEHTLNPNERKMKDLLEGDLPLTRDEIGRLVYEATRQNEHNARVFKQAICAALEKEKGNRAGAVFEGGGSAAAATYFASSDEAENTGGGGGGGAESSGGDGNGGGDPEPTVGQKPAKKKKAEPDWLA